MKSYKKMLLNIYAILLPIAILASCGGDSQDSALSSGRDSSAWFSSDELGSVGLEGLKEPALSTAESMQTSADGVIWLLTYKQKATESEFNAYAGVVFSYLSDHYDANYYGVESLKASGASDVYYKIQTPATVDGCYTTNPNPRYEIYYSVTKEVVGEGVTAHFAADKVFKITVDFYDSSYLQFFVEYATDETKSFVAYYVNA